jgi:hypothetical protein
MRNSPVTVTPRMAKKWLLKNDSNRPLSQQRVEYYAEMMRRGIWELNGDTIRFAEDGSLIDGQHRLAACILSNTSFTTYVVTDLPKSAFDTIDQGKSRSHGDVLAAAGEKHYTTVAAALSILLRLKDPNFNIPKTNPRDLKALLRKHPGIREAVAESVGAKVMRASLAGALRYVCGHIDAERAKQFFDRVEEGTQLTKDMPEYVLRTALLHRPSYGAKLSLYTTAALAIKAWNAAYNKQPLRLLKMNEGEPFPAIAGAPADFQPSRKRSA